VESGKFYRRGVLPAVRVRQRIMPESKFNEFSNLPMFVMDVLRHDVCENIPSIVKMLNDDSGSIGWKDLQPSGFTETEVRRALQYCISNKFVVRLQYSSHRDKLVETSSNIDESELIDHDEVWFALTKKGKEKLQTWSPPDQDRN